MTDLIPHVRQAGLGAPQGGHIGAGDTVEIESAIVAESAATRQAFALARRFAALQLPILLVGPTGTGKEVMAQAIHRWSQRTGPMVEVDCGALPQGMVLPELFGHRKGAFTGAVDSVPGLIEHAHRGTLFLDELASLPGEGQAALMRVLETGVVRRVRDSTSHHVDLRLIGAIHDPYSLRSSGRLREDLYQRLAGAIISLAPLAERPEDLTALARRFGQALARRLSEEALGVLHAHSWPGNIRELRHVITRAALLSDEQDLTPSHIRMALRMGDPPAGSASAHRDVETTEVTALRRLCQSRNWDADGIALALGISRATLFRRLKTAGISLSGQRRMEALHRAAGSN